MKKESLIIYSGKVANQLLGMGHRIIKVLPDKSNKIKTVFVFKTDSTLTSDIISITDSVNPFEG